MRAVTSLRPSGWRSMLEDFAPAIPDWAQVISTRWEGKRMGRGLDHFRKEGAKLIPPPTGAEMIPMRTKPIGLWTMKRGQVTTRSASG